MFKRIMKALFSDEEITKGASTKKIGAKKQRALDMKEKLK